MADHAGQSAALNIAAIPFQYSMPPAHSNAVLPSHLTRIVCWHAGRAHAGAGRVHRLRTALTRRTAWALVAGQPKLSAAVPSRTAQLKSTHRPANGSQPGTIAGELAEAVVHSRFLGGW